MRYKLLAVSTDRRAMRYSSHFMARSRMSKGMAIVLLSNQPSSPDLEILRKSFVLMEAFADSKYVLSGFPVGL
jgi:hypothetical protein